ncbi:D-3-phosphoglycerate dehydrogenase, chloroplastic [Hordeum vulgare]|nr:D-3-phosphoglycerate dehydrogenase, chloroplastic [Hordeum vulgare]
MSSDKKRNMAFGGASDSGEGDEIEKMMQELGLREKDLDDVIFDEKKASKEAARWVVAGCREPVHCITCKRAGHISRHCPKHPKFADRADGVKSRLGPVQLAQPLFARLRFPPPQGAMSALAASLLRQADPARCPRDSRSVAVPSPAIEQAAAFLRSHAVTLRAADGVNATSPMAVGRALEAQLSVPVHSLRVTAHHPEHYFIVFTQPALQVNAVRRGSIKVDGTIFIVSTWHEHDHAVFDSFLLHVRVAIEGVPMHYWSVEGAEDILGKKVRVDCLDSRTLERGHTKTFACWVWTNDVANIPTKHTLAVLPRGAGRVEEMEGFSPPDRRVAPPPATADYTMLVHVDRIEDWTTPSPRSSHSGQSGLPPSDSDHDSHPFPAVTAASWTMGAEDGQRGARAQHREHAPVASTSYSGMPHWGHDHEHDGDGGSRDPVAADVQVAAEAAVAAPLDFGSESYFDEDVDETERVQLDAFSPMLSAATTDCGQFNRATPTAVRTMEVQLGAVTSRVCQLEITADDGNLQQHRGLFCATEPPILATPAKRPSAPPKSRTAATPTRHNARLAANTSAILVAQRASFRIVKELGLLGPREKLTEDVAKALIRRFEEPLSDNDIAVIAKLTHLDSGALRVMACMAGPDGHAAEADV